MDLLPPTAPASFSRARLAGPILSGPSYIVNTSRGRRFAGPVLDRFAIKHDFAATLRRIWSKQPDCENCF